MAKGATTYMHDTIVPWIADLRDRLARGEFAGRGLIDIGYGTHTMSGEQVVRIMLADLDHCDEPPTSAPRRLLDVARRQDLLEDFRRLRDLIE